MSGLISKAFPRFTALLQSGGGSASVGFLHSALGAVARKLSDKAGETLSVKDFGAKGDGVADDAAAIQAAITYLAGLGGGTLLFPAGRYRITAGLVIGWGVRLVGVGGGGFPYHKANSKRSILVADFGANVGQWVIDSDTYNKPANTRVAYNAFVDGALDASHNSTHQVAIEGIDIVAVDQSVNIIYGGVRLVGCPDAKVRDVTVIGTGIGFQLNTSFASEIRACHSETHYYGVVLFESNNSAKVDGYFNKIVEPARLAIPADRILSFLPTGPNMAGSLELDAAHTSTAKGLVIAAGAGSSSQVHELAVTLEYWDNAVFMMNAYSNVFRKLYCEGTATQYLVAGAFCSATFDSMSAYTANATAFDVGFDCRLDARVQGLFVTKQMFRAVSNNLDANNRTNVTLRGVASAGQPQFNRVAWEADALPLAYVSFSGADLGIKKGYNVTSISRVANEAAGDYWIDFKRPSNSTGEVVPLISIAGAPGQAVLWPGGGDGIQNNRIRVRCMTPAGAPFDPQRLIVGIYG